MTDHTWNSSSSGYISWTYYIIEFNAEKSIHLGLIPGSGSVNKITGLFYEWLEGEANHDHTPIQRRQQLRATRLRLYLSSKHRLRKCKSNGTPLKAYGTRDTELVVTTLTGERVVWGK